jgi:DNA primase
MTDTQAIKDRVDIVQLISEYMQLKKAGVNWKGNCPFHKEKTPSFMVHPEKQIWHCFGCGKGGDVFTFLEEMEGLEFSEALKLLADRAGVKIENFAPEINKSQKNRILEINEKAAYFFHHFLLEMAAAQNARDYLNRRQLKQETIEEWNVGFIPEQWDLLTQYLLKKGNSIDDLIASGLTIKKEGADLASKKGYYDRFRGRIMFPIWDVHGNIVGFTGRVLVETERSGGKYVNTPQTLVYDKSRVLYGLNKAKMEIKNKDLTVLVEGQMDVIACHQAGMKNVVAASGTALTLEQVRLLKRYSNNIAMAFDADAAGQHAAKRGIDVALEQGLNIKIIQIPEGAGKDADECLKKNPAVWFASVEKSKEAMEWYFSSVLSGLDTGDPKKKRQAAETLLPEIARLPFATEKEHWIKNLSERLDVDVSILREEISKYKKSVQGAHAVNAARQSAGKPAENSQMADSKQGYYLRAENLWSLLLKYPALIRAHASYLKPEYFTSTPYAALYEKTIEQYNNNEINVEVLSGQLQAEKSQNAVNILLLKADKDFSEFGEEDASDEVASLLVKIKEDWTRDRRKYLAAELIKSQIAGDKDSSNRILREIVELND